MPILMLVSIFLILLTVLSFPFIEFNLRLWLKARNDYRTARGTVHLKLLEGCLRNLRIKITSANSDLERTKQHEWQLSNDRGEELETAATRYLVELEFRNIPGIGPVLRERILRHCFDGKLHSLRNASYVHGIGEQKAYAINRWVNYAQGKLPKVLNGSFPGKDGINERYNRQEKETKQKIFDTEALLGEMQELEKNCVADLQDLKRVHVSTFVKSYKGDPEASTLAAGYLVGCFPEWGKIPPWFKSIVENYGHA
jgi:hypothetical protein